MCLICLICLLINSLLELKRSGAVLVNFDGDLCCIIRENILNEFWPFHQAEVSAVNIVFIAHIEYLIKFLDAVEIEMVNRVALSISVFIDYGECW